MGFTSPNCDPTGIAPAKTNRRWSCDPTGIFFKENLPLNISALHSILTKTIISVHKIEHIFMMCYMEFAKQSSISAIFQLVL